MPVQHAPRDVCPHTPPCPTAQAADAAAAHIVSDHLEDCRYALLCNGAYLLEGEGLFLPPPRTPALTADGPAPVPPPTGGAPCSR